MSRPNQTSVTSAPTTSRIGPQRHRASASRDASRPGSEADCKVGMARRVYGPWRPAALDKARGGWEDGGQKGGPPMTEVTQTQYAADLDAEERGWYEIVSLVRR